MAIEDSSTLQASFETSLILDKGTGNPTFARPSTLDVTNSEGGTTTVPAGVAAFHGARLVNNFALANSEVFNTGEYEVLSLTITGANEVTSSASGTNTIRPSNAAGNYETYTAGQEYALTYIVKPKSPVEVGFVQIITNVGMMGAQRYVNFDIVNGTVESSDGSGALVGHIRAEAGGAWACSIVFTAVSNATTANALVLINSATAGFRATYGTASDRLDLQSYMVEDITSKVASTPNEYISANVLSNPWHGAGADGYKWFATDEAGVPVSDSNLQGLAGSSDTTLSYQTTSNINDTAGAIAAKVQLTSWASPVGEIGSATTGLSLSSANSGIQALDGTNTVNGPTGTPSGLVQMAVGWSGSSLKAAADGTIGTPGTYDGSLNLSTISIDIQGNVRNVNIWISALTDAELEEASGAVAATQADLSASGVGAFSVDALSRFRSDVSAAGVGSVSIDTNALFSADVAASGASTFSGVFSVLSSADISAPGLGIFSGDLSAKSGVEFSADGAGTSTINILVLINVDLSALGVGSTSFDSQLGSDIPVLSAVGVGGFDADGAVFASSSLTSPGVGVATIEITAIKQTDSTMSGVGAFAGDITVRAPSVANMPGQALNVINISALSKTDASMLGIGVADFDLLQQGLLLTADGIGTATFIKGGTVPILHATTIGLELYSETIDLELYSKKIDLTA